VLQVLSLSCVSNTVFDKVYLVDGVFLVSEAMNVIRKIKEDIQKGAPQGQFVHEVKILFSLDEILRISKMCFESLCIISHYVAMKVECKILLSEHCDFQDVRQ